MEEKGREAGTLPPAYTESPTTEPALSKRRGGAQKRKFNSLNSSNSTPTPSKRLTREKAQLSQPPIHNGPLTRARQAPNNIAAVASTSVAGATAADSAVKQSELAVKKECSGAESVAAEEELNKESVREALETALEAEYEAIRSRATNVHVVPNHCGWFSWGAIHPIEERMLPAFFNGKTENRSPDIYMEIRDWIMRKFQETPNAHISLKDLTELDVGSLDARQEVMEFLEYWGLINFHPFPSADPTMENADDDGAAPKNSMLEKLYHFEMQQGHQPPTPKALAPKSSVTAPAVSSGLFPEPSIAEELIKPEGPSVEYHCNSCSADCSRKRYHCQTQADFDLCFDCFSNGKFDSDMSSSDFILMESAEAPGLSGGKWTDQETLLLLEALELYRENWNEIAEHVATKTKAQCILHFLQMPIEDAFLNYDDHCDASSKRHTDAPRVNNHCSSKEANETIENNTAGDEGKVPTLTETSKGDNVSEIKVSEETPKADDAVEGKISDGSSQPEDSSEAKIGHESTEDCAFKALTEAFEAIGYVPGPDGPHSFAEVGNPVMALAIFLGRLVGSDVAFASSHASLKSMSGNSPSVELAARNCFILEDPPTGRDHQKHIEVDEKNEKQVVSNSASNELSNNHGKKIDRTDSEDKKLPISPSMESSETPDTVKKYKEVGLENLREVRKQSDNSASVVAQVSVSSESGGTSIKGSAQPTKERNDTEESNMPSDKNESQQLISEKASLDQSGSLEASKHADLMLESGPLENNKSQKLQSSDSAAESSQPMDADIQAEAFQLKDEQELKVSTEHSQQHKSKGNEDSTPQSFPLESNDLSQSTRLSSMVKSGDNGGDGLDEESNLAKTECTKPNRFEKVKRAAVSVLTAAAVKAKVLADSEEDQIRQLTALLIEKQLHKLEAKLAFFNDMENVVMRARENLDRTRQKLYHERAQIIASRLGLPPSSSRVMPPSFPTNRIPMNYTNSIPRPSMIMPPQRPPLSKPMGTMFSAPPNPLPSATAIGNMARLANQDKLSGGTK